MVGRSRGGGARHLGRDHDPGEAEARQGQEEGRSEDDARCEQAGARGAAARGGGGEGEAAVGAQHALGAHDRIPI